MLDKMINAALEENPIAFKREFEAAMSARVEDLKAQEKIDIAQSIRVDGEVNAEE